MKGDKKMVGSKKTLIFAFVFFFIIAVSVVYLTGLWGHITGRVVNKSLGVNITVGAPVITAVFNGTGASQFNTLNSGPFSTGFYFNFTAYHGAGSQNLNDSTAKINLTFVAGGEPVRTNASCMRYASSANYVNYTCNVTMWWYDAAGNWNITASIVDNNSNGAKNDSVLFALGATTGFEINPSALTWSSIGAGSTNQTSNNDPVQLNNTGNQPVGLGAGTGNISINATNLHGESNSAYTIWANNFSVSISTGGTCSGAACLECGGGLTGNLSAFTFANVTTANLTKGNYTINDGFTGEEELYFCLRIAGSELTSQSYSTIGNGSWIMRIY